MRAPTPKRFTPANTSQRLIACLAASAALLLASCAEPPPDAYFSRTTNAGRGISIGNNAANEACVEQPRGASNTVDVFCGTWQQPSATVTRIGPGGPDTLAAIATTGPWRAGLDVRFVCQAAQSTTVLDGPALVIACNRKVGGWPQVALVASVGGQTYEADGIQPALPVISRAIGIMSGRVSPAAASSLPASGADALMASRLAAQAFGAGDIGQYQQLMLAGTRANLAESYVAAEEAYRAALAIQQKALGKNTPDAAPTLALIALQLSDQGRYSEADQVFAESARLAPRANDPAARAKLLHYEALNEFNQHHNEKALALLREAESRYAALLPREALTPHVYAGGAFALARAGAAQVNNPIPDSNVVIDPTQQSYILGVIETRRYQAIVLRDLGHVAESDAATQSASNLALDQAMRQPILTARLMRTAAVSEARGGDTGDAAAGLGLSTIAFGQALPGTRPVASTEMLRAAEQERNGDTGGALESCRAATALLRELKAGAPPDLLEPCLAIYAKSAASAGGSRGQTLLAEMFDAAQQGQGSITSEQIARATARLAENARDPKVGEAIRRRENIGDRLADLTRQRDAVTLLNNGTELPGQFGHLPPAAQLDASIAETRNQLADADAALQTASPNFGQLVQEVVPASDVLAALRPGEAFASISLGTNSGWVFLLRSGAITAAPLAASPAQIGTLVKRFRASVEAGPDGNLRPFDTAAAQGLYAATLAPVAARLAGAQSLIVAPTGPLLSVPFNALLTGPAGPDLAAAPWLVKQFAIAHVPAAANFVSLRRIAGTSRAAQPWYGLGAFKPVTLAQAERTFQGPTCVESAKLFASLPPLPFAAKELEASRALLGGSPSDELLGASYTAPAVLNAGLKNFRILHFASHALLPAELSCSPEPAIVTSAPAGAPNANGALLTASLVASMDLDADAVILSACNSAGPEGPAGESLSGLARAFFYAGARAMLVTHWSVNDQASAFLVADTLRRLKAGTDGGLAGSLRGAELGLLEAAGKAMPAELSHPFYWAPFALIGEGGAPQRAAEASPGPTSPL